MKFPLSQHEHTVVSCEMINQKTKNQKNEILTTKKNTFVFLTFNSIGASF